MVCNMNMTTQEKKALCEEMIANDPENYWWINSLLKNGRDYKEIRADLKRNLPHVCLVYMRGFPVVYRDTESTVTMKNRKDYMILVKTRNGGKK